MTTGTVKAEHQAPSLNSKQEKQEGYKWWVKEILPFLGPAGLLAVHLLIIAFFQNYFAILWFFYAVLPILDLSVAPDKQNYTEEEQAERDKDKRHLIPLYSYAILDYVAYIWSIYYFTVTEFSIANAIFFIYSMANFSGFSLVIGHELFHRKEKIHKVVGTLCYFKAMYMHFFIEHVFGHHRNVALQKDPATSRMNESLYSFLPRTMIGGFVSAFNIEKKRLLGVHKDKSAFTLNNRVILFTLCNFALVAAGYLIFGVKGALYQIGYAVMSITLLEIINYVEHYGLQRKDLGNGKFESVNIKHSWNAPHRITNYLLFKLQRHSDHHANSFKPYQSLCSYEESPTLPNGYSCAITLSMIPTVWCKVMNPLAECAQRNEAPSKEIVQQVQDYTYRTVYAVMAVFSIVFYLTIRC